ncbi:MAG: 2-nitropropane dioxygenase [Paenibacillaceae bacterium ZCTH02-B3]|nr:MAG: 2-nitropropane dioxygenase [Paenibacillaceae bacterium ZCTH02-B3]
MEDGSVKTRITELLKIKLPIIQGGLAYLAYAELAAAVSNAGGLGQISTASFHDREALREEIRKTKSMTSKPFGVNFPIGHSSRPIREMLETALEEGVNIFSFTGGNPEPYLRMLDGTDAVKLVLVSTVRQAQKAESLGADAVMAVGQEGGGHIGREDTGTMVLIPRVVDSVSIPVVAAGGIADGRGLMAAFALGAEGIEMGTRFIATKECVRAHPKYIEAILKGTETDTVVIKRSIGTPGRAVRTPFVQRILDAESTGGGFEAIRDQVSGERNRKFIHEGDETEGFGWAGQGIGLIRELLSVQELFDRMVREAAEVSRKWGNLDTVRPGE